MKIEKLATYHFMFLIDMKFISKIFEIYITIFYPLPILIFTNFDKHEVLTKDNKNVVDKAKNNKHEKHDRSNFQKNKQIEKSIPISTKRICPMTLPYFLVFFEVLW